MAQERFHNYGRPIVALDENSRIRGIVGGVMNGFDTLTPLSGNQCQIAHDFSGQSITNLNGTLSPQKGCFVTKQGGVIYETEAIVITIDFNPSGSWRKDILIATHSFIDSEGGSPATYSVLKGYAGTYSAYQTPIGEIYVAPGAVDHTATSYRRFPTNGAGQQGVFNKAAYEDILRWPHDNSAEVVTNANTYLNDFNQLTIPGIYFINTTLHRPNASAGRYHVLVMGRDGSITQFAQAVTNGKAYTRTRNSPVAAWSSWVNLNNPDVPAVDFTPILTAIGDRLYTEDNFVTDSESLTASVNALDIQLADQLVMINDLQADVNNLLTWLGDLNYPSNNIVTDGNSATVAIGALDTAIGNRAYADNRLITDSESITASLDKLDKAWKVNGTGVDLDNVKTRSIGYVDAIATNVPAGLGGVGILFVIVNGANIYQIVDDLVTQARWKRISSDSGASWGSWTLLRLAEKRLALPAWDMDANASSSVAHGLTLSKIVEVSAMIVSDAATAKVPLTGAPPAVLTTTSQHGWIQLGATDVFVYRLTGGTFDVAGFSSVGVSRGDVIVRWQP